jgi:DNA-binding Lrp family transcriptional regulator
MRNKVLQILREEARLSEAEIAKRLGISEADVAKEIEALETSQTVLGYRAVVNPEKLPEETCLGIIEVKITRSATWVMTTSRDKFINSPKSKPVT